MKKPLYLLLIALLICNFSLAQAPEKFNYQAVIRDNSGELITEQSIDVKISIINNTADGTVLYTEAHNKTTNAYGLVNLIIGEGTVETGTFSQINWGEGNKFLNIEVDAGSGFTDLGTVQLLSVPFALYADIADSAGIAATAHTANISDVALTSYVADSAKIAATAYTAYFADSTNIAATAYTAYFADSVNVAATAYTAYTADVLGSDGVYSTSTDTLFVVKDHSGNVVFAVFPDGAQVIVNETVKGSVGGFAVSGRSPSKAVDVDILKVTADSTRIYVSDSIGVKGKVGGFAVSGRSPSKGLEEDYLMITPDSTRIYVNQSAKGSVGGFAVSGRSPSKGTIQNIFVSTIDSTRIFTKDAEGGFGVRDRSAGSSQSYLQLSPQNYFIGHNSGINNTGGSYNLFLGYESGRWNNTGGSNVFIGPNAGHKNSTGFGNIFIGNRAGYSNSNIDSSACIGTEGYFNVYIGYNSGGEITRGKYNTYVGYATCASGITGEFNTYIGNQAGNQSKGNENVFLGVKAGELAREGSSNVFLGNFAGQRCYNGSKNVFIGYFAGYGADVSDKLYIDNSSTSSPLIYGDFTDGSELVQINGDLHITGTLTGGKSLKSADFVFEKKYKLESIEDHAEFMWKNKHLPALKGQRAIEVADGYDMIERREAILEELEKAHIYIEQLNTEIKFIKEENQELKQKLNEIIVLLESK